MASTMTGPQTGGCLCGNIKYQIQPAAEPVYSVICHCDNCKRATGTHYLCNTIFQKDHFSLTSGAPKTYRDGATDSGTPLYRHFCGDCGSGLFITTPLVDGIVSILSGTLDRAAVNWKPNKEQYIEDKSHWLPDFELIEKEGVQLRHAKGPSLDKLKPAE
ncbi:Mss4-like protein [Phyllosticta citribraziliensis]|uniref:Mss4-like protein n=1 Tax=Phyllosticta citribraziliensis TaxID=989973 RepID=A0ABR1LRH6_9PEZI